MAMEDKDRYMLDYLMSIGALEPQKEEVAKKRATVEQLRAGAKMPGMRSHGAVNTAAHPLEALGALGMAGMARYKQGQADDAQTKYAADRRAELERLKQNMLNSGGAQQAATPGSQPGIGAMPPPDYAIPPGGGLNPQPPQPGPGAMPPSPFALPTGGGLPSTPAMFGPQQPPNPFGLG